MVNQRLQKLLAIAFCLLPLCSGKLCFGEAQSPSHAAIAKLVAELDDENYQTRERATFELIKIGKPAVFSLKKAFEGGDEAKWRAITILKQIGVAGEDSAFSEVNKVLETLPGKDRCEGESILANLPARRTNYQNRIATKLIESKGGAFGRDQSTELAIDFVPGTLPRISAASATSPSYAIPIHLEEIRMVDAVGRRDGRFETFDGPVPVELSRKGTTATTETTADDELTGDEFHFTEKDADEIITLIEAVTEPTSTTSYPRRSGLVAVSSRPTEYSSFVPVTAPAITTTIVGTDIGMVSGEIYIPKGYHIPQAQSQPNNTLVLAKDWRGNDDDLRAIGKLAYVTSIVVNGLELSPKAIQLLFTAPSLRRLVLTNTRYQGARLEQELASHPNVKAHFFGQATLGVAGDGTAIPFQVEKIHPDSGAAVGGVKSGDVILEIDGVKVLNFLALKRVVAGKHPGDKITVTVQRGEQTLTLTCPLSERETLKIYKQNNYQLFR